MFRFCPSKWGPSSVKLRGVFFYIFGTFWTLEFLSFSNKYITAQAWPQQRATLAVAHGSTMTHGPAVGALRQLFPPQGKECADAGDWQWQTCSHPICRLLNDQMPSITWGWARAACGQEELSK